ncbi:DEKNAAC103572 [Brettanomyces naardenensis]|uniref:DEKNAAC103572 n=1 Tax=Brettanomyces naardenensis TaxID=13370 RepID=A0A448YNP4_BRENA|nr:DEKNAAC103572 [Brettanomyces naardenensis]
MTEIAPEVLWAQRSSDTDPSKNIVFLTVRLIDPSDLEISLTSEHLKITAKSEGQDYKLNLDFFAEIDEKASHYHVAGSHIAFILVKKELKTEYWPRLIKQKARRHYIRTDFEKWVDEDEQNQVEDDIPQNPMDFGGEGGNPFGGAGGNPFGGAGGNPFGGAGGNPFGGPGGPSQLDIEELARKYAGKENLPEGTSGPSAFGEPGIVEDEVEETTKEKEVEEVGSDEADAEKTSK